MIGFIGCGSMGSALLEGIATSGLKAPGKLCICDQDRAKTEKLQEKYGVQIAADPVSLCRDCRKIFLLVKPLDMPGLLQSLKPFLQAEHILITVAAGLNLAFYQGYLNRVQKVVRLMPNAPCLVGEGMIAVCKNENVTPEEVHSLISLLEPLGRVVSLDEVHFDAVTAISGSGPAYIFMIIEALADGGVEMGLSRDTALLLASQTVLGAARMYLKSGEHPAVLKNKVTSPAGTTSAGLLVLEENNVRASFIKAVRAAAQRGREMGKNV